MKVNFKKMYLMLREQKKALESQLNPQQQKVNEIPENFNQTGWDSTIELVEEMLQGMKELREIKGKRLTPQFYRSIYNRALIANSEIEKLKDSLNVDAIEIDFEQECMKLNAEIFELNKQLQENQEK